MEVPTHFQGVLPGQAIVGTSVPRPFDQRHTFYADAGYRPGSRWRFNVAFQFHSGWPYTLATRRRDLNALVFGPVNEERAAVYHRLDARISRHFAFSRSHLVVFVEFMNLMNRNNVRRATEVRTGPDASGPVSRGEESWTSLLPSFGLRWDLFH